ncbi:MAG: transcription factor TFIIB [Nitrosopumilus sp.]|uniref:transcription initiation factor IIB n=1 Tax=Nitrosopumilus sp. TaxID=2024843 RepID=UPI00242CDC1B|nr:transcription factor TFIIB [Nitrosopumilus sp.]MCV0366098.1 transcription factor TFIIB [Nitrosopumilus sp.]
MEQILEYCFNEKHISPITDVNTGEIFCSNCGIVLLEKSVDRSNDSNMLTKDNYMNKTRNGPPSKIAISDMSKSSIISKGNFDANGNKILVKNKIHFSRLRFWDSRIKMDKKEKNLVRAFTILDAYASKLNIPENAKEHSAYIYRKAMEKNIIRGSSIPSIMAASVYTACKQLSIPRSADEISKVANMKRKLLSKTYRRLVKNLELKINVTEIDYTSKVANTLSVSEKTARLAHKIIDDFKKEGIHVGKNPIGIAGASIYLSAINHNDYIPMAKISQKTDISIVTIRKTSKLLKPFAAKYIKSIDVKSQNESH